MTMLRVEAGAFDQTSAVEHLLGLTTHQPEARLRLAELLDRDPSTSAYLKWSRRLPSFVESRRVALISSYTVETISPFLAVEAYLSGWRSSPSFIQYSNWQPALLDPSASLDGHDAAVLLLDDATIVNQRLADSAAATTSITDLLGAFRAKSKLPLFIGLAPSRPNRHAIGLGHEERVQTLSQIQWFNSAVSTFCAQDRATRLIDVPGALAACGSEAWHDADAFAATISYVNNKGYPALARAIARSVGGLLVPRYKVLVTDLDGTLWGGVLGEDGVEGISAGKGRVGKAHAKYQGFLRQLRASGILLAIVSKNDEPHVREAFETHAEEMAIGWEDFTAAKVNWKAKSENLREIADELGLGLDSFVFVDDSPVECEEVRHSLPMVTVIPVSPNVADLPDRILASRAFDTLTISREDHTRADQYRVERARKAVAQGSDIEGFLASLELKVALSAYDNGNADRILQLLLKTNQFHLTLERPSSVALTNRLKDGCELYAVTLADRFGDYGIIGAVELEVAPPSMMIRNLAVSCRALGRKVEDAIVAFAAARAREKRCERLVANYVTGPRNHVIEEALQRLEFTTHATGGAARVYALPVTPASPAWPKHVKNVIAVRAP